MKKHDFSTLSNYINKFSKKKVMVIGDLLLDQYLWGGVSRISPEAPVPVVWVQKESFMPGGACNVANNIAKLGGQVTLVGVIGDDIRGEMLKNTLKEQGMLIDGVFTDSERPTSLKTRVIAHNQQVVRIDKESLETVKESMTKKMIDFIKDGLDGCDGVIIEDYGKGVITPSLLKAVVPYARKKGKIVSVDPKEDNFSFYKGVSVITPNKSEAEKAVGFKIGGIDDIKRAGEKMMKKLNADNVLITLGELGMMLFEKGKKPFRIPTVAQEVFDVTGAGDTVIAVYTLASVSGGSPSAAAHIANCAAGIVVGKVGSALVDRNELLTKLKQTDTLLRYDD